MKSTTLCLASSRDMFDSSSSNDSLVAAMASTRRCGWRSFVYAACSSACSRTFLRFCVRRTLAVDPEDARSKCLHSIAERRSPKSKRTSPSPNCMNPGSSSYPLPTTIAFGFLRTNSCTIFLLAVHENAQPKRMLLNLKYNIFLQTTPQYFRLSGGALRISAMLFERRNVVIPPPWHARRLV